MFLAADCSQIRGMKILIHVSKCEFSIEISVEVRNASRFQVTELTVVLSCMLNYEIISYIITLICDNPHVVE